MSIGEPLIGTCAYTTKTKIHSVGRLRTFLLSLLALCLFFAGACYAMRPNVATLQQELANEKRRSTDLALQLASALNQSADLGHHLANVQHQLSVAQVRLANETQELANEKRRSNDLALQLASALNQSADLGDHLANVQHQLSVAQVRLANETQELANRTHLYLASKHDIGLKLANTQLQLSSARQELATEAGWLAVKNRSFATEKRHVADLALQLANVQQQLNISQQQLANETKRSSMVEEQLRELSPRCEQTQENRQCMGLMQVALAASVEECQRFCCSMQTCELWQFKNGEGCWVSDLPVSDCSSQASDWYGGRVERK